MNFKTNFSKLSLLGNEIIKIYFPDKTVEFVPPNIRLYLMDIDFLEFLFLLKQDVESFKKMADLPIQVDSSYEVLLTIIKVEYKKDLILKYFKKLFPNLNYEASQFKCDGMPLSQEEYEILLDFLLVSCAEKDFDTFMKQIEGSTKDEEVISESQKRFKALQEKIEQAKKKNKKEIKNKKDDKPDKSSAITIDQIVIAILYEFSNLAINDVYDMNMVTLLEFWKYVSKVVDTQIQIVAAGNGNVKKFTYFIN